MRIAFDARSLSSSVLRGWDRYLVGLAAELTRQGIEVTLFHRLREGLNERHIADLKCEVVGLADRSGLHWEQVALPAALRRGDFDLFHAPAEHGVPIVPICPTVLTIHSLTAHSYKELIESGRLTGRARDYLGSDARLHYWNPAFCYWRVQVARANHIVCPSEYCRDEIIRFLSISPASVTTTFLAVHEQFRKPPNPPQIRAANLARLDVRRPYLLYVGGFEVHKNLSGLLEAFSLVRASNPHLSLVIVGSKTLPEWIVAHAERQGLRAGVAVVFLTDVTEALTDLYDGAELLVTLSWRETFCLPALEAMTRGVPAVASAWGAAREVVGAGGRLVDPRDHEAFRNAVLELLAMRDRRALNLAMRAQADRFTWAATATKTMEVYRSLISGCSKLSDTQSSSKKAASALGDSRCEACATVENRASD